MYQNIAIIGAAGKLPMAESLADFRNKLVEGADCVRTVPEERRKILGLDKDSEYIEIAFLDEIANFDAKFFKISNKEAKQMSPEQRLALETAAKTILDAGYSLEEFKGSNCSVIVSSSENTYGNLTGASSNGIGYMGSLISMLSGKISYYFDLHGSSHMVDTGCSSSLVGIHQACLDLITGQCDYSLVGGVSVNLQFPKKDNSKDRDLFGIGSTSGRCYSFDSKANGSGIGEGVGFVLLKRLEDAERDGDHIYAVIKGSYVNSDGVRCNSMTSPSVIGQEEALKGAWKHINPLDITEIEAHGTGTPIGDPIEITSLTESFKDNGVSADSNVHIGCVKSNIGHLGHAAGIAGIIKTILSYQYNERYPIANFEKPNPLIDFKNSPIKPVTAYEKIDADKKRITGVSSFSLNGTNAHVLLENYQNNMSSSSDLDVLNHIVKISAKSKSAILAFAKELKNYFEANENISINDAIYTLNTGRDDYDIRKMLCFSSKDELIAQLDNIDLKSDSGKPIKTVFLITKDTDTLEADTIRSILQKYRFIRSIGIEADLILVDKAGRLIVDAEKTEDGSNLVEKISEIPVKTEFDKVKDKVKELSDTSTVYVLNFSANPIGFDDNQDVVEFMCRSEEQISACISNWYNSGKSIKWDMYYSDSSYKKTTVPTYCFDKNFYWLPIFDMSSVRENTKTSNENKNSADVDVKTAIKEIWKSVLEQEEDISDDDDFFNLGGNSLLIAALLDEVNAKFDINIEISSVYDCSSFEDFCNMVLEKINETGVAE